MRTDPAVQVEITQMRKEGYIPIYAFNGSRQTVVDFYFNHTDYQRPAGDEGRFIFFWSSSPYPFYANFYYRLHADTGRFWVDNDGRFYVESAIRCVVSP